MRKEVGSWKTEALKGRQIIARGNAPGLDILLIAPRLTANCNEEFVWGKRTDTENIGN